MDKAQKPVYGDAQKASFMSEANKVAESSMESIKSMLARSGASNSGRAGMLAENVGLKKMGDITSFMSQLPFLNEQARSTKVGNLLGQGMNWFGKAPVDQQTTGSSLMDALSNMFSTTDSKETTEIFGAPWWKNLLSQAGSLATAFGSSYTGGGSGSIPDSQRSGSSYG